MFGRDRLPADDAYELLSNDRRRETVATLLANTERELTLRELSERVATRETGVDPAPRTHRASVYNALHQTHLPKLQTLALIEYDRDRKLVRPRPAVRSLYRYIDTVACFGLSWAEYYRLLGIVSLLSVVVVLAEVPYVPGIDPLVLTSAALAVFALSTASQLAKTFRVMLSLRRN
ncbi:DUF7344 domain-containing protein [Haloarcula halophila]|uniref:DUF7344 domain-containing protein n=1 Tax=Haloarcula TaxID=2237 RepID=UPI0023E41750|nr:hypothetical protein [Halomicroarcula sp. DFY41]